MLRRVSPILSLTAANELITCCDENLLIVKVILIPSWFTPYSSKAKLFNLPGITATAPAQALALAFALSFTQPPASSAQSGRRWTARYTDYKEQER
ncbi:hypothetical protein J6590_052525 [Homalodisca vitripennis]|nr:hypothetical protein J6590_052525 [Homalodisca vitripennis]